MAKCTRRDDQVKDLERERSPMFLSGPYVIAGILIRGRQAGQCQRLCDNDI